MDKQNSSPKADNAKCTDSSKMVEKINKMEKELALMKEKIDTNDATISGTGTMNASVSSNCAVENSVELAKQLDAEFHENVFEHFPKLAFELKELCQKYGDLDLLKMVEENAKLNVENWAVFVIGKQLEKMSEQIAKIVEMMPKREDEEQKEHKYYDGEDTKLPELDKRLAELYAQSISICKYENCAGRIHAVRDRLILYKYRVDDVLALEFINQMITMTREIHDDAEKIADFVSSFAIGRKTKTKAAYVHEHDQTFVNNMAKQLKKVYSRLFSLHQILKENFKLLDSNVNEGKKNFYT